MMTWAIAMTVFAFFYMSMAIRMKSAFVLTVLWSMCGVFVSLAVINYVGWIRSL